MAIKDYSAFFRGLFLVFLLFPTLISAQNSTEALIEKFRSLEKQNSSFSTDTARINLLNLLSSAVTNSGDLPRADSIATVALIIAENGLKNAGKNEVSFYKKGIAKCYRNLGNVRFYNDNSNAALDYYFKEVGIHKELLQAGESAELKKRTIKDLSRILRNIANVYMRQDNFPKAIEFYFNSIKEAEKIDDLASMGVTFGNMGSVYFKQLDYKKSLEFYEKGLKISVDLNDSAEICKNLSNIGMVHSQQKNYEKALIYLKEGLKIAENIGSVFYETSILSAMGANYVYSGKFELGHECLNRALQYAIATDDKGMMSNLYGNLGGLFLKQNKFPQAEKNFLKAIEIAKEIGELYEQKEWYFNLSELYKKQNNPSMALKYFEEYVKINDSIFNEENSMKTLRFEMDFEYGKKAAADSVKNAEAQKVKDAEIAAQQAQIRQDRTLRYSLLGGLMLVIVFSVFLYNRFKITTRQKSQINIQKLIVEEKNKEITDSITYARRLQNAIMPSESLIREHLPDSFIYYKPKAIIAGDFYWMNVSADRSNLLFAVADSTGHGVPGAMVSIVCSNALNRSVNEFGLTDPGKILDKTRDLVLETFAASDEDVTDGMDISLVSIAGTKIRWAGANNPLWYIRSGEFGEITAHKQPIGKTDDASPFPTHIIDLGKGDMVYLISDGYPDQFGGPKGKKFKYQNLKNLFMQIHSQPVDQQLTELNSTFNNWKGGHEQVDDVSVVGLRI